MCRAFDMQAVHKQALRAHQCDFLTFVLTHIHWTRTLPGIWTPSYSKPCQVSPGVDAGAQLRGYGPCHDR